MASKVILTIDILTIFPAMFRGVFAESLIGRAQGLHLIDINLIDIRRFASDKRHTVDDRPFGGGAGMVMKVEPVVRALKRLSKKKSDAFVVLLSPQGIMFNHQVAKRLAKERRLVLICGHYEGIDERIRQFIDEEISVGDFVLTGGEIPAMIIVDAVARLVPGVVKKTESIENDSFFNGRLDYPHYTRPRIYKGISVPDVLISGNHRQISLWRKKMSLKNTIAKRPDLLKKFKPTDEEKDILKKISS